MKRKILLSAVFIVLAISCVFAEQYTAQVILNIQDDTKVAWTSAKYEGGDFTNSITDPVKLEKDGYSEFSSGDAKIYASGSSNLDVGAARIKIYGTPLYEDGNNTDPERIDYTIVLGEGESVGVKESAEFNNFGSTEEKNISSSEEYGYLLAEFSSSSKNDNGEGGGWQPWVFSVPITIETVGNAQDTVNKMAGGTSLTGTLTLCVESS